ncbi:unnamed protein product [Caenorhabditis auriculariae]|uniref:Uncharacterized protein n=1 Tax=Caenorhabditis auriculariae TaxID=2777116 RepID=A0A8S1HSH8_9PELO|nr:unnamed protein product [Caenorhabditis auriculariae]
MIHQVKQFFEAWPGPNLRKLFLKNDAKSPLSRMHKPSLPGPSPRGFFPKNEAQSPGQAGQAGPPGLTHKPVSE